MLRKKNCMVKNDVDFFCWNSSNLSYETIMKLKKKSEINMGLNFLMKVGEGNNQTIKLQNPKTAY
jgi:hypothetical protein